MELKVDNFIIQLHRAEETSHEEEVKRLGSTAFIYKPFEQHTSLKSKRK